MDPLSKPIIIVLPPQPLARWQPPQRRRRRLLARPLLSSLLACSIAISACTVTFKSIDVTTDEPSATVPVTVTTDLTAAAEISDNVDVSGHMNMSVTVEMGKIESEIVMSATQLRATLDLLLGEHVVLAASTTDALLRGRSVEFKSASAALDANAMDLAEAIALIVGQDTASAFLPLWRKHLSFVVNYANASGLSDEETRQQTLVDLDASAEDFGIWLESANPALPKAAAAELLRQQIATLTTVIDAQATKTVQVSGDQMNVYPALRTAFAHMEMVASGLSGAISQQFPERLPSQVATAADDLHRALTQLLTEHTLLLIKTIDAATHARTIEYEAAFAALDDNSVALAQTISTIYGAEAGNTFQRLWRKHIGLFIDYSLALINGNNAAKEKAAGELMQYHQELATLLHAANPNLALDTLIKLASEHTQTVLTAIDASADDDMDAYYAALRTAYNHMSVIAYKLSEVVILQLPDDGMRGELVVTQ